MNKRRAKTTIQNLPKEILFNIFTRLPLQEISNCRFLCKDWFSYIADPDFATLQHHNQPRQSRFLLFGKTDATMPASYWVNLPDNEELLPISSNSFQSCYNPTPKKRGTKVKILGSFNGLICLRYKDDKQNAEFHICNPITRDTFRLPKPPIPKRNCISSKSGFGFDSTTNTYKVVHSWYFTNKEAEIVRTEVVIFTLGTEKWKKIQNIPESFCFMKNQNPTFLHNALHFKMKSRDPRYSWCIGVIDIGSETFKWFSALSWLPMEKYTLCTLEDRLCLSFKSITGIVLWTMNEYGVGKSWTTDGQVLDKDIIASSVRGPFRILGTKKDRIVLLLRGKDHGYYDLEKNEFQRIQIHGVPHYSNSNYPQLDVVVHIGSLISPTRLSAIEDMKSTSSRCTRSGYRY